MRALAVGALAGVLVAGGPLASGPAAADVIHLRNGNRLTVDAWRDAGDEVEFARGGGVVRIPKREIERIEGKPTRGDLTMYSAPASVPAAEGAPAAAAADRMLALLGQVESLIGQTALEPDEKVGRARRLIGQWRGLDAPGSLREAYKQGEQAIQQTMEAFQVQDVGGGAQTELAAARKALADAREAITKATAAPGPPSGPAPPGPSGAETPAEGGAPGS